MDGRKRIARFIPVNRRLASQCIKMGGLFCHGCGVKGGNVLAFLRQRDGLSFKEAAQRLGAWDEAPSRETVRKLDLAQQERDRQRDIELARKEDDRRHRLQLRDEIHQEVRLQREASGRLSELQQGAVPESPNEQELCWAIMELTLTDLRLSEAEYCEASGLEYSK